MVAMMVKMNISLLQRCLKSKKKDVFNTAIDNLIEASNNYGPALNKHLPVILPLMRKRQDLLKDNEAVPIMVEALRINGGTEADRILKIIPLTKQMRPKLKVWSYEFHRNEHLL